MKKLFYFIFISSQLIISQDVLKNSFDDIYQSDGLIYRKVTDELFTGSIEFYKKENVLNRKLVYKEGYLESDTFFHNKPNDLKSYYEFIYHKEKSNPKTKKFTVAIINQYDKNGVLRHKKEFSKNGKLLKNQYYTKNGKLKSYCEYKNGVKHGKYVYYKKDRECIIFYENGKKISSSNK